MTPTIREFVLAMGSSLPASVVAKATVIAAFGLMGARLSRKSRAAVRHVLLAATFGALLLLPVASLIIPPVRIAVPAVRMRNANLSAPAAGSEWIWPFTPRDTHPAVTSAASRLSRPPLSALLTMGWLAGVALALIPMIASLWKIRCLRRSGLPWADGRKAVDRLSLDAGFRRRVEVLLHEELPGPIASGMLYPTILIPPDAQRWAIEDLNRALVHELEHLHRGDVATHCLARIICALYWFHPLVCMAWGQLILEAERSCDDAVISRSEATAYADQLVGLARRLLTAAKSPLLAMANRSDLVIRVGAVLDSTQRRGRAGRFAVALGCAATAVLTLTVSPLRTVSASRSARAQGAALAVGSPAPLPSFEVASIKPIPGTPVLHINLPPGRFVADATVRRLIAFAYNVRPFQVSGGPAWMDSQRYHIEAKVEDSQEKELQKLPGDQHIQQYSLRIQSLLAERFKLVMTHTTKELPIYRLIVAKNGPKLHEAMPGDTYPNGFFKRQDGRPDPTPGLVHRERGKFLAQGVPLTKLINAIDPWAGGELDRPVVDQTGLKGTYDIELQWSPGQPATPMGAASGNSAINNSPPPDDSGPSLFTAVQEQLGLKLEATKGPVEILTIDRVERPSEN